MIQKFTLSLKILPPSISVVFLFLVLILGSTMGFFSQIDDRLNSEMIEIAEGLDGEKDTEEKEKRSIEVMEYLSGGFYFSINSGNNLQIIRESSLYILNPSLQPPSPPPDKA